MKKISKRKIEEIAEAKMSIVGPLDCPDEFSIEFTKSFFLLMKRPPLKIKRGAPSWVQPFKKDIEAIELLLEFLSNAKTGCPQAALLVLHESKIISLSQVIHILLFCFDNGHDCNEEIEKIFMDYPKKCRLLQAALGRILPENGAKYGVDAYEQICGYIADDKFADDPAIYGDSREDDICLYHMAEIYWNNGI